MGEFDFRQLQNILDLTNAEIARGETLRIEVATASRKDAQVASKRSMARTTLKDVLSAGVRKKRMSKTS